MVKYQLQIGDRVRIHYGDTYSKLAYLLHPLTAEGVYGYKKEERWIVLQDGTKNNEQDVRWVDPACKIQDTITDQLAALRIEIATLRVDNAKLRTRLMSLQQLLDTLRRLSVEIFQGKQDNESEVLDETVRS